MAARDEDMIAEIDLHEDGAYVVKEGRLTKLTPMSHGTDEICWNKGLVLDVVRSHRVRLNGQKEISEYR